MVECNYIKNKFNDVSNEKKSLQIQVIIIILLYITYILLFYL